MSKITFDLDVLRSFVTGIELGGFAKAADRLGRSTSAVSAQLKKLEEQAGVPIFRKAGRGLALTEAGETMLSYSRRLLELNDEAVTSLLGMASEGWLRVGLQQDFGDLLPKILGRFARAHPKIKIEARIARNAELIDRVNSGKLDFALAWSDAITAPHRADIANLPVCWIGPHGPLNLQDPLALVSYDDSCWFRSVGTAALDRANRPWRIALTSPNLSGLWAGVEAGLGLSIRTPLGLPPGVRILDSRSEGLPDLPSITLAIIRKEATLEPAAERLVTIMTDEISRLWNTNHSISF